MTWNGDTLTKLTNTGLTAIENGVRTTKIGGTCNYDGKSHVIHSLHEDKIEKHLYITVQKLKLD